MGDEGFTGEPYQYLETLPRVDRGCILVYMSNDDAELPVLPSTHKYMPCRYCKKPMVVGAKRRNAPGHIECAMAIATANVRQIHAKEGPYYDRWLAGQAAYLARLTQGGVPPTGEG